MMEIVIILVISGCFGQAFGTTLPTSSLGPLGLNNRVVFYYYPTPNDRREIILGNINSLQYSGLRNGAPTVLLIDGFLSNGNSEMSQQLKNAFLGQRRTMNVIVVDWGALSGSGRVSTGAGQNTIQFMLEYVRAVGNTRIVAEQVSEFLNFIRIYKNIPFNQIFIVGHSLGAHIAGQSGDLVKRKYGGLISRISGLDPAGPLFSLPIARQNKLNYQDAYFVDIYHTNQGSLGDSERRTGHINVFLNGGSAQPGCGTQGYCSHSYSWKIFSTSFFQGRLFACPCTGMSCKCRGCHIGCSYPVIVGVTASNSLRGDFYVSSDETF